MDDIAIQKIDIMIAALNQIKKEIENGYELTSLEWSQMDSTDSEVMMLSSIFN